MKTDNSRRAILNRYSAHLQRIMRAQQVRQTDLVNYCKISAGSVSDYCCGRRLPLLKNKLKIDHALGVRVPMRDSSFRSVPGRPPRTEKPTALKPTAKPTALKHPGGINVGRLRYNLHGKTMHEEDMPKVTPLSPDESMAALASLLLAVFRGDVDIGIMRRNGR